MLIELLLARDNPFVLALLNKLVVNVSENVIPHDQSRFKSELSAIEHSKPLKQAELWQELKSLQVLMELRIHLSHHMVAYLVTALSKGRPCRINLLKLDISLFTPPEPLIVGHRANVIDVIVMELWRLLAYIEHVLDAQVHDLLEKEKSISEDVLW